ncbi:MAG: class I SAM-dependent methyltransferase [Rhodococcus sp. (in: high G+C Gram-positive bacteria)]|uniref:class I SAM-dependent methyltransferase n=1 Tax=Rhodococcus sp. TaxID=1831 RepID=UPI003BB039B4
MTTSTPLTKGELIDQRGRSELEFLQALRAGLTPLRKQVRERVDATGVLDTPYEDIAELRTRVDGVLEELQAQRLLGIILSWSRGVATPRAAAAFNRKRSEFELLATPAGEVVDHIGDDVPRYWDYEFHGTAGGWDGHPHMGFIHHEMIYHYLLKKIFPGDIFGQRGVIAAAAPAGTYERIVDLGCGTGQYTLKLAETYPTAKITAVDLSRTQVQYALRRAEDAGITITGIHAAAENTGLPGGEADLVTSFILLHEVPPHTIRQLFVEAFRLLKPGGHVHFSDVAPYSERSPYQAWLDDWDAAHGNEPWWRTSATIDLVQAAADAGFVDINQVAHGPESYPWVTTARKPE